MKSGNIQELFSYAVEDYGDFTAIEFRGRHVSYSELSDSANVLANFLIREGAPKGSVVAVLAHSPVNVITAIIACLKAGCIFVPLDPATPDQRLQTLCEEVSPLWFLTESELLGRICQIAGSANLASSAICLDGGTTAVACSSPLVVRTDFACYENDSQVQVASDPDDPCYIYFTSGSTGRPKGIVGRLKGIDHFIRWEVKTCGIEAGVRVSQLTSPAFDAFLRDVFLPLCTGGTICVPESRDVILDSRNLVDWIDRERINLIHCVPSLFRSLINAGLRSDQFAALRYVLLSGEPLLPSDVGRWMDVFGERVQLINLYGPTETTMTKFFYMVQASDSQQRRIPIGKPMEGARALVVDAKGNGCRPGSVGEIYIRTPYRTHGYWQRPELTGEVFVPNPFGQSLEDLVYKTGDLGRVLADGNFEFLGRQDHQVKVRGARVELDEIQEALRGYEAISDVAVVDLEGTDGNKYLCAYVVSEEETDAKQLREYLLGLLPEYMVPTAYVLMESLPRTLSGKIDRRALPAPAQVRDRSACVAPRNPVEEVLAGLWCEVLGADRIGIKDNFFELGGHSLLATQLLAHVRAIFKVEIPLRRLFELPTVEGVARSVAEALKAGESVSSTPIKPMPRNGSLPLSFAQQRLWFLQQMEPQSAAYNMTAAVRLSGPLDVEALEQTFTEIVRRHEVLRTTFSNTNGQPVQLIQEPCSLSLPLVDLSASPLEEREQEARRLADKQAQMPFSLASGPLLRVLLLRLAEEEHVLVAVLHHIISDGWSIGVLVREMMALYEAYRQGQKSPLAELPIQYADYALWQREWLQGAALAEQLEYWRKQLAGAPPLLQLPTDRIRTAARRYEGEAHNFVLQQSLAKNLKEVSRKEGVTPFMTLLASFQVLLQKYTGQNDLIVGTDIANRNRVETENLIGFFVNQLALRTDLSGDPTFSELLHRVREVTLGAYAHQDLPFDKLVEELQPERSLSHTPLFQVLFVVQNAPASSLQLSNLSLSSLDFDNTTSKFDLILMIMETDEGLRGLWRYSTDLFEPATIERMTRQWQTLLANALAQPDTRLNNLELLTPEEQEQERQEQQRREENKLNRLKNSRRAAVSLRQFSPVKTSYLESEAQPD